MSTRFYAILLLLSSSSLAHAQISNKPEQLDMRALRKLDDGLYFSVYSNNFFKNNEYFLPSLSGYTLFGTQNTFALTYKPNKHVSLQGGIYLKKDFGTDGLVKVAPWYQLDLHRNGYSLTFGNLAGNIGHGMIDPMYGYERLMTNYQEHGIQLKADKKHIYTDLWVDWQKQQYYGVNYNERFTVGNHTRIKLSSRDKAHRFSIPVQLLASHNGGQWDTTSAPTVTLFNAAVGLDWAHKLKSGNIVKGIGANAYYLYYKDLAGNSDMPYRNGSGIYANANVRFKDGFYATLSYWQGRQFISPTGGVLFQSQSFNPNKQELPARERKLITLGLAYQRKVMKEIDLDVRLEPFYDLNYQKLNYNYSLFLTYQPHFLLKKGKLSN
ncbi:hypothetical protein [Edaphocola aurantiacus]|uniref:hypothetical protein n=1 Tax=Edaphocola aurantiacus TaxID=2601682 RepID=UPI001C94334B|nr:hypothetical protein [Edaphocola aurantiacus]